MSYCVRLHPEEQHIVMAGTQDKKICQWDLESGDMVQSYDYHLAAVNTVTFIDQNRRFVSTSGGWVGGAGVALVAVEGLCLIMCV